MSDPHELAVTLGPGLVTFELDESLYRLDAIYGAAYVFLDRCYILLDRASDTRVRVSLRSKTGDLDGDAVAGEFQNELLGQTWRRQIADESRALIEAVTARALAGAAGPPGLDDLLEIDVGSASAFEDPLGIAMSWEEKYAKKNKADVAPAPADTTATGDAAEETPAHDASASQP